MSRIGVAGAFLTGALIHFTTSSGAYAQQHGHGAGRVMVQIGAHAVGVARQVSPALLGRDLSEGYLTQPALMVHAMEPTAHLSFTGMLNLEGLTLRRGELDHGIWGEGYIDRRHPHTYLHDAVATVQGGALGLSGSLAAGRGFAPFGTDDPMVRPFVSYPANHHLSQILERWVAIAALRRGPASLEFGTFNGDEPTGPKSLGRLSRFGDSWSARATLRPLQGVELQASYARVESPELPSGGGLNQRKRNTSARFDLPAGPVQFYALVEKARNVDLHGGLEAFVFESVLGETGLRYRSWRAAVRYENTTRPEEERRQNLFRSVRPLTDHNILGVSRWRTWTTSASREIAIGRGRFTPFAEFAYARVQELDEAAIFDPVALYGDDHIRTVSAGIRIAAGMKHARMGRYGAAVE
ncbi:MAG TPA: hypothetical protein VF021_12090 [Longimicrobiales bacterium]